MQLDNALTIPTSAVLHGTKGDYVYALNTDKKTVQSKPVVVSMNYKDDSVITSGLTVDDVVVTEGTDKLVDGASIVIHEKDKIQNEKKPLSKGA
jgi:multidrug efflux system membrane fusion protein